MNNALANVSDPDNQNKTAGQFLQGVEWDISENYRSLDQSICGFIRIGESKTRDDYV
jgi:hypothetical protein